MLDFAQANRFSAQWHLKREIVFDQLEEDNLLKIKTLKQNLHASAAAYGDPELYKHHFDNSVAEIKSISEMLFPWIDWATGGKAQEYQKIWEDWFGIKVGSPEWQEIERQGEMLQKLYKQDKSGKRGKIVV